MKVDSVNNAYSFYLFLLDYIEEPYKIVNCKGIQASGHECLLKEKGLSEERVKELCGCKNILLQCELVSWITHIQEDLVPDLQQNKPGSYKKYHAYTYHNCGNRNQIYEWKHMYQSYLRQFISNTTPLPLFSLNAKPHLQPDLYLRL